MNNELGCSAEEAAHFFQLQIRSPCFFLSSFISFGCKFRVYCTLSFTSERVLNYLVMILVPVSCFKFLQ